MAEDEDEEDIRKLLKNKDFHKTVEMIQKNPKQFDELLKLLKDEDPIVRRGAACCLGELRNPKAVDSLIQSLDDENGNVRKTDAEALQKICEEQVLNELLKDENLIRDYDTLNRSINARSRTRGFLEHC